MCHACTALRLSPSDYSSLFFVRDAMWLYVEISYYRVNIDRFLYVRLEEMNSSRCAQSMFRNRSRTCIGTEARVHVAGMLV